MDLLYVTTISPGRIIRGKLLCGAYITLLFFSACFPFMVFSNLLRGVDLPTVFIVMFFLFLAVCCVVQATILFAVLPISRGFKVLLALPMLGGVLSLVPGLSMMSLEVVRDGVGSLFLSSDLWKPALAILLLISLIVGLVYLMSVAFLSPPAMNRAFGLRIYVTSIWLLGFVYALFWVFTEKKLEFLLLWTLSTMVMTFCSLVVVVSNSDRFSLRIKARIPRHPLARLPAFFFFNGAAGGLCWVLGILGITLALTSFLLDSGFGTRFGAGLMDPSVTSFKQFAGPALCAYAVCYALTGLFLHRRFLPSRPAVTAGVLTLLVPGLTAVLPPLAMFLINRLSWNSLETRQLGNVFNLFYPRAEQYHYDHLVFSSLWLVLMIGLNLPWFLRQVREFTPPPRTDPNPGDGSSS